MVEVRRMQLDRLIKFLHKEVTNRLALGEVNEDNGNFCLHSVQTVDALDEFTDCHITFLEINTQKMLKIIETS